MPHLSEKFVTVAIGLISAGSSLAQTDPNSPIDVKIAPLAYARYSGNGHSSVKSDHFNGPNVGVALVKYDEKAMKYDIYLPRHSVNQESFGVGIPCTTLMYYRPILSAAYSRAILADTKVRTKKLTLSDIQLRLNASLAMQRALELGEDACKRHVDASFTKPKLSSGDADLDESRLMPFKNHKAPFFEGLLPLPFTLGS